MSPDLLRLKGIRYNFLTLEKALSGIQLLFTGGYETPLVETKRGRKSETKTVMFDHRKAARSISMLVDEEMLMMFGLRLKDSEDEVILEE